MAAIGQFYAADAGIAAALRKTLIRSTSPGPDLIRCGGRYRAVVHCENGGSVAMGHGDRRDASGAAGDRPGRVLAAVLGMRIIEASPARSCRRAQ